MLPSPPSTVTIRDATLADVPFFDAQQKAAKGALGFFPTKQFEGYVRDHLAIVAECNGRPIGHLLARDRYSGRDELGIVYQVSCIPEFRRRNVRARLVQEAIARAAYGVRLYCCWCRQDLAANKFWESLGFVPVAFRSGGKAHHGGTEGTERRGLDQRKRTQVFWQRRVCVEDEVTPLWYPFQTRNGAIREDRLVFPMGTREHWSEARPPTLPENARKPAALIEEERLALEASKEEKKRKRAEARRAKQAATEAQAARWKSVVIGGKRKRVPLVTDVVPTVEAPTSIVPATTAIEVASPKKRPMQRYEKAAITYCRELRDRWQEVVSAEPSLVRSEGLYEVARALPAIERQPLRLAA